MHDQISFIINFIVLVKKKKILNKRPNVSETHTSSVSSLLIYYPNIQIMNDSILRIFKRKGCKFKEEETFPSDFLGIKHETAALKYYRNDKIT